MNHPSLLIVGATLLTASPSISEELKLKIVTEGGFPPWNYTDSSGAVKGFEIDLMGALCKELNASCTIESQTFDAMIPAVNDGKYDMIVDVLGITEARKKIVDFTTPYASLCYSFATVNPEIAAKLPMEDRIENLNDQNSGSIMGKYADSFMSATIGTFASGTSTRFVAKNLPDISTKQYKTPASRNLDLKAERIDVIFASKDSILDLKKKENISALQLVGPCLTGDLLGSGGVGIGVKKGNEKLINSLNPIIEKLVHDGTIKSLSKLYFDIDMSPK